MDPHQHDLLRQKALAALDASGEATAAAETLRLAEAELEVQAEELQRAHAASEAAKRRYEQLFRAAPVGLLVLDSAQLIMEANDAAAEFLRAPPRLLFGVSLTQFLHPRELGRWQVFLQRALPTEFTIRRWGGDRAVARLKMLKVDGQSAILALEDLTDLRSSAVQSRGGASPYQVHFQRSQEPALVLDLKTHRVLEATEGLCVLLDASRADLVDRMQEDLFAAAERPRAGLLLDALAKGPEGRVAQAELCSRSGEVIPVELSALPGTVEGVLMVRLRDRRSPRPFGAGAPALVEAERLEAVARMAGGVAHDLNNVLTAITSTADVLRAEAKELPGRVFQEGVEDLRSAAAYGVGVARSLLQLTRQVPQHHQPFDLAEVVRSAQRMLERALPVNLRIKARLPAQPCVVEGNPTDWERVLINLAFNAADACPAGGEVELTLEPGPPAHTLTVRDDGAGMTPEVRDRAFEPFFTTKEPGRGTGLGLAQVAAAVAAHQAQVIVESAPGQGTTLRFTIPASARPLPAAEAAEPRAVRPLRLLLVEDEPIVRKSLARRLGHLGLEVVAVSGGEEALAAVAAEAPQVVLTDLSMPGMDGLTLARRLRSSHPGVPVIVMSGHVTEALRPQLEALGVRQLDKPFGEHELAQALEAVLPGSPSQLIALPPPT